MVTSMCERVKMDVVSVVFCPFFCSTPVFNHIFGLVVCEISGFYSIKTEVFGCFVYVHVTLTFLKSTYLLEGRTKKSKVEVDWFL